MDGNRTLPQHYLNYLCYLSLYSGNLVICVCTSCSKISTFLLCHLFSSELGICFGAVFSELKSTPLRQLKQRHSASNALEKHVSSAENETSQRYSKCQVKTAGQLSKIRARHCSGFSLLHHKVQTPYTSANY